MEQVRMYRQHEAEVRAHSEAQERARLEELGRQPQQHMREGLQRLRRTLEMTKNPTGLEDGGNPNALKLAALHQVVHQFSDKVPQKFGGVDCIEVKRIDSHTMKEYVDKANFEADLKQGHWPRYLAFVITKEFDPDDIAPARQIMAGLLSGNQRARRTAWPMWRVFAYLEDKKWYPMEHTVPWNTGASDTYPEQGDWPRGHAEEHRATLIQAVESELKSIKDLETILFKSLLKCIHDPGNQSLLVWPVQTNDSGVVSRVDFGSSWGPLTPDLRAPPHEGLSKHILREMSEKNKLAGVWPNTAEDTRMQMSNKRRQAQAAHLAATESESEKRRRLDQQARTQEEMAPVLQQHYDNFGLHGDH